MNDIADKSTAKSGRNNGDPQRRADGTFKAGHQYRFKPGQSGNPSGRPPDTFGRMSREINERKASDLSVYANAARKLSLDPAEITVGELLVHAAKVHALSGKAPYLIEDNYRREGRQVMDGGEVQTEVRIHLKVDPGPTSRPEAGMPPGHLRADQPEGFAERESGPPPTALTDDLRFR